MSDEQSDLPTQDDDVQHNTVPPRRSPWITTAAQDDEIREMVAEGKFQRDIAAHYGVHTMSVHRKLRSLKINTKLGSNRTKQKSRSKKVYLCAVCGTRERSRFNNKEKVLCDECKVSYDTKLSGLEREKD